MATKSTSTWTQLKKQIEKLDQKDLLKLVKDLYYLSADNQDFFDARFADPDDHQSQLKEYRARIVEQFFYRGRPGELNLRQAKSAISQYKKATNDLRGTLDLMLVYIEQGIKFLKSYGDGPESLYNSIQSVLEDIVKIFKSTTGREYYLDFQDRLNALYTYKDHFGYGLGDEIEYQIKQLRKFIEQH